MDDVTSLDATAQAELVRRREVKPLELIDAAIGRIERLNPTLNAIVTPLFEQARAIATRRARACSGTSSHRWTRSSSRASVERAS